ncbi:uncharacterized protein CPUR_08116 [Claviceps purpurea 20.1]|uniref:Uncharacterized protein n=1 Tax=Claviceps purpurea (strain 20.1) TaxID=1111077 RepID=M1WIB4_CLAP2|nr:uncharacterized protein CPUR_08116 [Claviceps purpurea 20.1]
MHTLYGDAVKQKLWYGTYVVIDIKSVTSYVDLNVTW